MIKELITENTNVIEFYLIQKPFTDNNKIDITITDDLIAKIKSNFKKTKGCIALKKKQLIKNYKFNSKKYKSYYWLTLSPKIAVPILTNVAPCSIADL